MSLGQDTGDVAFQVRDETDSRRRAAAHRGRGITMPEPGRTEAPYWVTTRSGRPKGRPGAGREEGRLRQDLGGRPGRQVQEADAGALRRRSSTRRTRTSSASPPTSSPWRMRKGLLRAGIDAFAHGVRDKDIDDEIVAMFKQRPNLFLVPNLPDRGVAVDLGWLSDARPPTSWRSCRPPPPTGPPRSRRSASRRAIWRS